MCLYADFFHRIAFLLDTLYCFIMSSVVGANKSSNAFDLEPMVFEPWTPPDTIPNLHVVTNRSEQETAYWGDLLERIEDYDPSAPEAAHLRGHQVYGIDAFRNGVRYLAYQSIEGGLALLHPTGSGKTVTAAEVIRMG